MALSKEEMQKQLESAVQQQKQAESVYLQATGVINFLQHSLSLLDAAKAEKRQLKKGRPAKEAEPTQ